MKFTNSDGFLPIRKVSDIQDGQTIVCFLSEAVIQKMTQSIDAQKIQELSQKAEQYADIVKQAVASVQEQ